MRHWRRHGWVGVGKQPKFFSLQATRSMLWDKHGNLGVGGDSVLGIVVRNSAWRSDVFTTARREPNRGLRRVVPDHGGVFVRCEAPLVAAARHQYRVFPHDARAADTCHIHSPHNTVSTIAAAGSCEKKS